ncbi:valine--tRNA ligase [Candidatus Bathyarchaeota archaeon RBG_16_57_9]|nr:MAG: valine--tRNA ligase [Candidatus Bathyarchaeota archaeon RBG_16_57_9]
MNVLPSKIDFLQVEEKWQKQWEQEAIHRYDWNDTTRPVYSVDTPPPYPSGDFHMGNVLNWTYFDIRARYKRMRGYNVLFPQGWDCHGLPTEVAVEKAKKVRKSDVPPDVFRRMCEEWIEQYIAKMKTAVQRLGISIDWTTEYRTMEPEYLRKVQLSFLMLYEKDMIYKGEHPINWCPRCETAIADAEVEHDHKTGKIYTIPFNVPGGEVLIATTRPVYLPACVALGVHPGDKRYSKLIGKKAKVPVSGQEVPIIGNNEVDPTFGTGAMMICTYGDKADVVAVARFNLPVVNLIDGKGVLLPVAGKYAGMRIQDGQKVMVKDMRDAGLIREEKDLDQEVGLCWRCDTPIEVVNAKQWFMRTISLTEKVVETAKRITWYPDWMRQRLIDWATGLDWDWVLSRQRIFATPVPAWYCKNCGRIRLAKPEELPVDPKVTGIHDECMCGSTEYAPDTDVLDTWFDSSLTCAIHAGWPDKPDWRRQFPASVHPSGQDIIRTWAYYLMVRHLALFDETPYDSVLINGMVLGADGRKMSKSLGNFVSSPEVFGKYGCDAPRQWAAAGGSTGTDIPFRWEDVEYGWRFMRKLWNACRFASMRLEDYDPATDAEPRLLDRWITSRLQRTIKRATEAMEECDFMNATEAVRNFIWHTFCDDYLEAAKTRLYGEDDGKTAAQHTLYATVATMLKLMAPIAPHLSEEIWRTMYDPGTSVNVSPWPVYDPSLVEEEAERTGDAVIAAISEIRREKNRAGVSLNAPLKRVEVWAPGEQLGRLRQGRQDIVDTLKVEDLVFTEGDGGAVKVEGYPEVGFTVTVQ